MSQAPSSSPPQLPSSSELDSISHKPHSIPYKNLQLTSSFQPIFCLARRRVVGYEALIRARTAQGEAINPFDLFGQCPDAAARVELDRLCRSLHVRNFAASGVANEWLFLNVTPATLQLDQRLIGSFFGKLLERYQIAPSRIVVEILEGAAADLDLLENMVNYYKSLGCLVALDDFGVDSSDVRRIWQLSPNIVKLDRHIIAAAVQKRPAELALRGLISMLHEFGSLALIEGVEDAAQLQLSVEANADLVQGYYLARPNAALPVDRAIELEAAANIDLAFAFSPQHRATAQSIRLTIKQFEEVSKRFARGDELAQACEPLLQNSGITAAYVLNEKGTQCGPIVMGKGCTISPLYSPLQNTDGANWSRRPYFRAAALNPGSIKIGSPYFSQIDASRCMTLSIGIHREQKMFVLCCDLLMPDVEG